MRTSSYLKTESLLASKQVNRLLARSEEERLAFEELDRERGHSGVWRSREQQTQQTARKCQKMQEGKNPKPRAIQPKGVYDSGVYLVDFNFACNKIK